MLTNCPKCNSQNVNKVSWTWWGGVLGPALINSTKCDGCGHTFNGKTGKSNAVAIVIYSVIIIAIGVIVAILV